MQYLISCLAHELSSLFFLFQVYDDEEDYFADILKDDIIKLDETSMSSALDIRPWVDEASVSAALDLEPFAAIAPEDEHKPPPTDVVVSPALHFQGIANRRIKLSMGTPWHHDETVLETSTNNDQHAEGKRRENSELQPQCIAGYRLPRLTGRRYLILVVLLLLLTFMVLFMYLLGDFWRLRRVMYSLYQSFLC